MVEMSLAEATVTNEGSVLLGRNVVCDGYGSGRRVGVVSHFHVDHASLLPVALRFCECVLTTPATRELLLLTQGEDLPPHLDTLKSLPYTESAKFNCERVTLLPAKHVLGAAQVLAETEEGNRLLYSGDFLVPGTFPPESDILVTEATYGSPSAPRRYSRDLVMGSLAHLIKRSLSSGPVSVITYQGKLQEVMNMLFEQGIDVPFLVPPNVFDVTQVYRKYGIEVGDCFMLGTAQAKEVERDPHVVFSTPRQEIPNHIPQIFVSGRCRVPFRQLDSHRYVVGLSTHADFNGLLWYVKKSKAKLVIVDGVRHNNAPLFARMVEKNLRIRCMVAPR